MREEDSRWEVSGHRLLLLACVQRPRIAQAACLVHGVGQPQLVQGNGYLVGIWRQAQVDVQPLVGLGHGGSSSASGPKGEGQGSKGGSATGSDPVSGQSAVAGR